MVLAFNRSYGIIHTILSGKNNMKNITWMDKCRL